MPKNIITLSQGQVTHIQALIGSEYVVSDSYGTCGAHCISIGIRSTNGTRYILKRHLKDTDGWLDFQLSRHKNVSNIFTDACKESEVGFETIESYGRDYYIARHLGNPLGTSIADMDIDSQKQIAQKLAQFLCSIHRNVSDQNKTFKSYEYPSLPVICDFFSPFFSEGEKGFIKEISEKIEWYRTCSFPTVFIHGDFRSDNILYCKDTGALSVIDFECSGFSNILREFALDAMSSLGFSYSFWFMLIDEYSRIGNTLITPELVRTLMVASIIHEYGRCAIAARASGLELNKRCQYMKIRLKSLFEEFR